MDAQRVGEYLQKNYQASSRLLNAVIDFNRSTDHTCLLERDIKRIHEPLEAIANRDKRIGRNEIFEKLVNEMSTYSTIYNQGHLCLDFFRTLDSLFQLKEFMEYKPGSLATDAMRHEVNLLYEDYMNITARLYNEDVPELQLGRSSEIRDILPGTLLSDDIPEFVDRLPKKAD